MKKLLQFIISTTLLFTLVGCNQNSNGSSTKDSYDVAIIKQLDHASLNEISDAIVKQLDVIAKRENITINYIVDSGNNDPTTLEQYASSYLSKKVDVIVPIATLAAQIMVNAVEETDTKVIYSAISDPEGAELVGIENVSGVSDALNTKQILDMMLTINPNIKQVGLLYSQSEKNSEKPIQEAIKYFDGKGITYVEATGNNDSEIQQALASLIASNVEAIFTPTDNVVMDSEITIAEKLIESKIPHYTGADSFVRNGAFITCGVNYTDLGTKTADLVYEALINGTGEMDEYYLMDGGFITVNTETAKALEIDYASLNSFGEIIEVETTEE